MRAGRVPHPFLSFNGAEVTAQQPRLYCFAYAGASASVYAPWARQLAPRVAVIGVELPGHGSRLGETPLESVTEMASGIAHAIAGEPHDAPYAFYGHSLGAVVAYETALLLGNAGPAPAGPMHLFVGAARAPHLPPPVPPISHLEPTEFLDAVQNRYGGLPAALFEEPELLEMVLPPLRADFRAYEKYPRFAPGARHPRLSCEVTAFHGTGDPIVHSTAVSAWSHVTTREFRHAAMDGDHFFLNTCRPTLMQHIREVFERSTSPIAANAALVRAEVTL